MRGPVLPTTTAQATADVQRASWENIVNIETLVRRTAVRMVVLV